jgi:hypothetical protein
MGIATILDPRCKTIVLLINYEELLGVRGRECEDKVIEVKNLLAELMSEYHVVEDVEGNNEASSPSLADDDDFLSDISARTASLRPTSMGFKSELDRYLDEELVTDSKNFNVLDWWKVAGTRYPTLRRIARAFMLFLLQLLLQNQLLALVVECLVSITVESLLRCWTLSCAPKIGLETNTKVHKCSYSSTFPLMQTYIVMVTDYFFVFCFVVDEKNKQHATLWSCL